MFNKKKFYNLRINPWILGWIVRVMLLLLFIASFSNINVCYAQSLMYKSALTASKTAVSSTETFAVTYSLSGVDGYIYIGVQYGYFETVGPDRWEGEIKKGETKTLTFNVRLKERSKQYIREKVPLNVGFSFRPFEKGRLLGIEEGNFDRIYITITDYKKFMPLNKKIIEWNDSLRNKDGSININLNIQPIQLDILKKNFQTNTINSEFYGSNRLFTVGSYKDYQIEKSKEPTDFTYIKNLEATNKVLAGDIIVQFYAASLSFRDPTNQQLPFQYFTAQIWGLQSPSDQNPVTLTSQIIESSTTGGFTISTILDYPYYKCAIVFEGPIYEALQNLKWI